MTNADFYDAIPRMYLKRRKKENRHLHSIHSNQRYLLLQSKKKERLFTMDCGKMPFDDRKGSKSQMKGDNYWPLNLTGTTDQDSHKKIKIIH